MRAELVVEEGSAESGELRAGAKGFEHLGDPAWCETGVGVYVSDEIAGGDVEAGLPGEGEAFARLVDQVNFGKGLGDGGGAVSAGVVDDDDLGVEAEGACLLEDGGDAIGQVRFLVIGGDDEAQAHGADGTARSLRLLLRSKKR